MEWGAEVQRDYSGWLTVAEADGGGSRVTVHLSFGPRSAESEIREEVLEGGAPLAERVSATLESIRRQIEEGTGKVQLPSSPGARRPPSASENLMVADERPSEAPQS